MKILFFNDFKLGVLKGDNVVDVSQAVKDIPHTGPHNLISGLIEGFADYRGALEKAVAAGSGVALKSVRVRPPLPKPVNLVDLRQSLVNIKLRTIAGLKASSGA